MENEQKMDQAVEAESLSAGQAEQITAQADADSVEAPATAASTTDQPDSAGQPGVTGIPGAQPPPTGHMGPVPGWPPGYLLDPATGQPVFVGFQHQQPYQYQYMPPPGFIPVQPPPSIEQLAARQAEEQQRNAQLVQTFEQFLGGELSVTDVVKNLYLQTSREDQLWKGVLVGAAAAVLLTSGPVKNAMAKTLDELFPGLKVTDKSNE